MTDPTSKPDPLTIYTEAQAAAILMMEEKTLRNLRYRGKINHLKRGYYRPKHLEDFIKSREVLCEDSQNSSNEKILRFGSSTARNQQDDERSALVRAKQIVARQNSSSGNGCSNGKSPSSRH